MEQVDGPRENGSSKYFLGCISLALIVVLLYPWIFFVSFLCYLVGYYLLDSISEKLEQLLLNSASKQSEKVQVYQLDPLLHPTPFDSAANTEEILSVSNVIGDKPGITVTCSVCDVDNCPRADHGGAGEEKEGHHLFGEFGKRPRDLCIDPSLDRALARFCTSVFDYYISTSWAPYETRKQLKLAFKRLLTNFGERLELTLVRDKKAVSFCEEKVIPLCIHYLEKVRSRPTKGHLSGKGRSSERARLEKMAALKTRRLCRLLLERNLPAEYQQCKLGMELCVSVLADGVLWNLILLGRNQLPNFFLQVATDYKKSSTDFAPTQELVSFLPQLASKFFGPQPKEVVATALEAEHAEDSHGVDGKKLSITKVPLLLRSFLDPANDLYQPDVISSRWRPTLDEILNERDLLYCLIQYLKGNQALEYLQAVLDDSPDGNAYCEKVLQLEYLPSFCRSKYFMETLGISQVDCALEAGSDSPVSRRKFSHTRSSSYGGGNSGIQIWKFGDPKAVDGLPLHTSPSSAALGNDEADAVYRRRQFSIEEVINKFLHSTVNPRMDPTTIDKPKRIGIHAKTYEDLAADEVVSQLVLGNCDIYDCASQVAISWFNRHTWIQPILSGWTQLVRPYVKPRTDTMLKSQLEQILSVDNSVLLINLITDAFLGVIGQPAVKESSHGTDSKDSPEVKDSTNLPSSFIPLSHWFLNQLVDPEGLAQALIENDDEIILFFVDLLDLLVNQICSPGK